MVFGEKDLFGRADDVQFFRVHLGDEQGCAMARDVVVVGSATRVDQKQSTADDDPVLLGVVAARSNVVVALLKIFIRQSARDWRMPSREDLRGLGTPLEHVMR